MTDQKGRPLPDEGGNTTQDDTYVLEDTGESLEDFEVELESADDEETSSAGGVSSTGVERVGEGASQPDESLQGLREENRKLKDQYLRRLADFENFRKRVEREKSDYFKYALADIVRELVPVLDNFERALTSPGGEGATEFRTGVEMIYKQFSDVLQRSGVRTVGEANIPFDPTIHEAVMREENASVPSQTVVEVLQKGYFLHDRLIRPAMVKVAVGGAESSDGELSKS